MDTFFEKKCETTNSNNNTHTRKQQQHLIAVVNSSCLDGGRDVKQTAKRLTVKQQRLSTSQFLQERWKTVTATQTLIINIKRNKVAYQASMACNAERHRPVLSLTSLLHTRDLHLKDNRTVFEIQGMSVQCTELSLFKYGFGPNHLSGYCACQPHNVYFIISFKSTKVRELASVFSFKKVRTSTQFSLLFCSWPLSLSSSAWMQRSFHLIS